MAAYPIITTGDAPVEITTSDSSLSYTQLISTLNYISFKVKRLYIEASSIRQVNAAFRYNTVRQNGQQMSWTKQGTVDLYQLLPILDIDMREGNGDFILDNLSVLSFTLQPHAYIEMLFFNDSVSGSYALPESETTTNDDRNIMAPAKSKASDRDHKKTIGAVIAVTGILILLTGLFIENESTD